MINKEELTARLKDALDLQIERGSAAGVNLLVLKDGEELAYVQSGYADVKSKKTFDRDTIMRMYSMTKPVTAVAVLILVQRGLISLGEPVSRYLPGFENQVIVEGKKETNVCRPAYIKDLLSMTSGLPYGDPNGTGIYRRVQDIFDKIDKKLYSKKPMTTVEIANELGKAGVAFQPGSSWIYGTSADILGAIVEVVSGRKYGDFLKEEIFEPLGMNDTGFYVEPDKHERIASVYERKDGKVVLFETNHLGIRYSLDKEPEFQSGGAGLVSTLDDYARFATMLINGGEYNGKRILEKGIVQYATSGRLHTWQQERMWREWDGHSGYSYGCLMQHMIEPQLAYFHTYMDEYGWDGWLGTYFCNSPHNKLTILMGTQISNPEGNIMFEKVKNIVGCFVEP